MRGVHPDTIMRVLRRVGPHCEPIMAERMRGLRLKRVCRG